ncbi:conserved hypothetical protein [Trichinella spiralis]|uniref:hypothetical protein n=1 Tax=Trichinella spiralis TaxID=6334 RepID=UPI0001EFB3E8|nr:conserved hypothetical protein [Trichinella spiralis]
MSSSYNYVHFWRMIHCFPTGNSNLGRSVFDDELRLGLWLCELYWSGLNCVDSMMILNLVSLRNVWGNYDRRSASKYLSPIDRQSSFSIGLGQPAECVRVSCQAVAFSIGR